MTPSLTLMGTGGPRLDRQRRATSLLLRTAEEEVLIDAGRGAIHGLADAGADMARLRRALLTHHHFDHIGDLYDVMLTSWLEGRRDPLLIQGPPDTRRIVQALLTQVYDKDHEWRGWGEPAFGGWAPIETQDVGVAETIRGAGWEAEAREVSHGHGLPDLPSHFLRRWVCYGWRIRVAGQVVAISGDTVDCPGLRELAAEADVLVMCCWTAAAQLVNDHLRKLAAHTLACGDTVGRIAQECGVRHLVLTHLRPDAGQDVLAALRAEVARDFTGQLSIAWDGMVVPLG